MNQSGDAAEQVVRMSLEGVEVAAKVTGSAAKEIAVMLIAALKSKNSTLKPRGKARLVSMLKSGKPLEIFSVKESDLQKFVKGAKQYGIVYCVLRNTKNSPDGLVDVMVKADDAPKISRLVERLLEEKGVIQQSGGNTDYRMQRYTYDPAGNIKRSEWTNNPVGSAYAWGRTDYNYDNRNRLEYVTAYDGGAVENVTKYTYDGTGNILFMQAGMSAKNAADGKTTGYAYDRFGNQETMTDALSQTETRQYNTSGLMTNRTDRNGTVFTYAYNGYKLPKTVTVTENNTVTELVAYTYYLTGAKKREESTTRGWLAYQYDSLGRLTSVSEDSGAVKTYGYDKADNRATFLAQVNNATVQNLSYAYDNQCRLSTVKENGVTVGIYGYDANGNRDSLLYANGVVTNYSYNKANWLTGLTNQSGGVLSSYAYSYYADGNQRTKSDHNSRVTTYTYDGLGRLTGESENTGDSLIYTYDRSGNRDTMAAAGTAVYSTVYHYDNNNRLVDEVKTESALIHTTDYHYDANGNQLYWTKGTLAPAGQGQGAVSFDPGYAAIYEYDAFNQMTMAYVNGETTNYSYRVDGLRKGKDTGAGSVGYLWDGGSIIAEMGGGAVLASYIRGANLLRVNLSTGQAYYLYNAHGDVTQLTDGSGNVIKNYDYDAWGVEKDLDPNDINPFRYAAEYYDSETGTYYLRGRQAYNPRTGRFSQEDPARAGLNWYTYCNNNPIAFIDPWGLDAILINKLVDNVANKIGVEHLGAFFQDKNDKWWYFFYGDTVQYVKVDDASIFDSMNSINQWLLDYRDPNDDDFRLLKESSPRYRDSVYIKGDFVASHDEAMRLRGDYVDSIQNGTARVGPINSLMGVTNENYGAFTNNCGQVTMGLFMMGTLPSGTNVSDYMNANGYGVAVIPNWNMINMQNIFYNKSTNLTGFEAAMQAQRAKYEGKNSFTQWWYSGLRSNINSIH